MCLALFVIGGVLLADAVVTVALQDSPSSFSAVEAVAGSVALLVAGLVYVMLGRRPWRRIHTVLDAQSSGDSALLTVLDSLHESHVLAVDPSTAELVVAESVRTM